MDAALVVLTAALVLVTAVYAYFTARMVTEQREGRLLSIRPTIALDIAMRSGTLGEIAVRNLGPGHAVGLELVFTFEPLPERRSWTAHTILAGDERRLQPPKSDAGLMHMPELSEQGVRVRASGAVTDVLGQGHEINEELDLRGWWELAVDARERLSRDPLERIANAIDKLRTELGGR